MPYDLGGSADIAYQPGGVHAVFRIPARHLSEPRSTDIRKTIKYPRPAVGHPQNLPEAVLADQDILLVEDSLIIALDAEDIAHRLGAASVTTAATVEGALEFIDAATATAIPLLTGLPKSAFPSSSRPATANRPTRRSSTGGV